MLIEYNADTGSIPGILPYPIVLSSPKESSRLPIEICEAVMNTLPNCYEFDPTHGFADRHDYYKTLYGQRALCAAVHESPITALTLGSYELLDASKASELFMHSSVRLQHFQCVKVRFDLGPPLRVLHMRLPFFAGITTLQLWRCTFQSLRAMLDVVWACPNLAVLEICGAKFEPKRASAAELRQVFAAVENLRACKKLTSLHLDVYFLVAWFPASAGLSGVGRMFGCAITELYFVDKDNYYDSERLGSLLRESFPALHSVTIVGRPIPRSVKMISLGYYQYGTYKTGHNDCCKLVVGTSEEIVGSEKRLLELLDGIEELTIRLDRSIDPGTVPTRMLPGNRIPYQLQSD
ncbi:hypothetical protein VTO73DRAFT_12969 [Trametes versicolor]